MTGSVTTEALVEKLARDLAREGGWNDPDAPWTENQVIIARGGAGEPVWRDFVDDARSLLGRETFTTLLVALQQVTAERDEARNPFGNFTPTVERIALLMGRVWLEAKGAAGDTVADFEEFAMLAPEDCADCCTVAKAVLAAVDPAKANERADAAEASLATATSELARLRAEGEAKDRALKAATDKLEAVCSAISTAAEWERAAEQSARREDERLRRNPLIRGAVEAARAAKEASDA